MSIFIAIKNNKDTKGFEFKKVKTKANNIYLILVIA